MKTTELSILRNELFNVGIDCGRHAYVLGMTADQLIQQEWDYDWNNNARIDPFIVYYDAFTLWATGVRVAFDIEEAYDNYN